MKKRFTMGAPKADHCPAFEGAHFDKDGYCLSHSSVQLCLAIKSHGKIMYEEVLRSCPSCAAEKKSRRRESRSHGQHGHHGHSRRTLTSQGSSLSKMSYDTPFDERGRCHYHKDLQLASRTLSGGWKVIHDNCPRCKEEGEERSVASRRSTCTARSVDSTNGQFDRNGCCVLHTHIQVAKKKVLGGGWKVVRSCPVCSGEQDVGAEEDRLSVHSKYSKRSTRSVGSRSVKSHRSGKSARSLKSSRSMKSVKSSRTEKSKSRKKYDHKNSFSKYGELPFDSDGYCCRHPDVLLAQRRMIGGWKIIHDICPDCAAEAGVKLPEKAKCRGSFGRRRGDADRSVASSVRSGNTAVSSVRKKHIRVKHMKTQDENGRPGSYTGDVNEDYRPHGQGKMRYDDGTSYEGIWNEGSQVHGKVKGNVHGKLKRRQSRF